MERLGAINVIWDTWDFESSRFFVGLDLEQSQDHSALAVVERDEVFWGEMDYATYEQPRVQRYRMQYVERLALGSLTRLWWNGFARWFGNGH